MSLVMADVDGDTNVDLVTAAYADNEIAWYKNDGGADPTFSKNVVSTSAVGARDVTVADMDGDGDLDILSASFLDNKFAWYEHDGNAVPAFTEHLISEEADGPRSVVVANIDANPDPDVIGASLDDDTISVFANPEDNMAVLTTAEDTPIVLSAANNNLIQVSDVDLNGGTLTVRLEVANGTVSLASLAGLAFDTGTGTDDAIVQVQGALADINNALDGMSVAPDDNFVGVASLRIITDDQGNSGTGGILTDDDIVNITVTPVNDGPVARPDGVNLLFDSNDIIRVADDPSLQMTNHLTMEAWINPVVGGTGSPAHCQQGRRI